MTYYFYETCENAQGFSRALFRYALEAETGLTGIEYFKDERGKPYIPDIPGHPRLHMSLSHCRTGIICIITDAPVGIDIEEISRMKLHTAGKFCTAYELALLEQAADKQEFLCRAWVLKEAYSKLTGQGMAMGFSTIETINKPNFYVKKSDVNTSLYIGIACEKVIEGEPVCVRAEL